MPIGTLHRSLIQVLLFIANERSVLAYPPRTVGYSVGKRLKKRPAAGAEFVPPGIKAFHAGENEGSEPSFRNLSPETGVTFWT